MMVVPILFQLRQKPPESSLRVPYKPEVNLRTTSELFPAKIDLHDGCVLRKELLIREVRSNHQQHIAIHHRVITGRESKQTSHAYIERVVVLDELFSAYRVHDRRLQLACQGDQFIVSSRAACAAKNSYLLWPVQNVCEYVEFLGGWAHCGLGLGKMQSRCLLNSVAQGDIAW